MITRVFANLSGLSKIAERFPAAQFPTGQGFDKQTLQIGAVRFRRCVTVQLDAKGVYLQVRMVFSKYPGIMIPWNEIKDIRESQIYGKPAVQFSVGEPPVGTIRVPVALFDRMKAYLNYSVF